VGVAQTDWRVDAALTRLQPVGVSRRNALSLSGFAQQQLGPVTPVLSGAATVTSDSVAAAQLLFGVSALPPWPPWSNRTPVDLGYVVALYGIAAGDRGQSQTVFGRQHYYLTENAGCWIGGAFGWIDRAESFNSNEVDAGAWVSFGAARISATLLTARTQDRELFQGTSILPQPFVNDARVGDASLSLQFSGRRIDADAIVGTRVGLEGTAGHQTFANASLAVRVSPRARIVFAAGNQLADPVRGTPQWRFVSLGVRLTSAATRSPVPRSRMGPAVAAQRVDNAHVRILVLAPATARSVEIVGTFTDWDPVALVRGPEGWFVNVRAAPGPHRIQVRIDGGEWRPPSNLPTDEDEYGKFSGLIVIP
jgi:hypothetical protein